MKRKGIARLIPWLIGLDVLLLTILLVVNLFHIRIDTPEYAIPVLHTQQPAAVEAVTPEPFSLGDEPEQILIDNSNVDRPAETSLPVGDEDQQATLVAGSFALRGGPDFSLYLDRSRFQLIENEGRCYFCPQNDGGDLYLEIAFFNGVKAERLAPSVFQDYGIIIQAGDVEDAELNGHPAKHVTAKTMENAFDAYVLDSESGCVTLVFCSSDAISETTQQALLASLQTFQLSARP